MIERLPKNDSHRLSFNHHWRNVEPKRGVLNVEGVESKIERGLTSKRLGSVEVTLGKMADMMQKLVTNISQLQELPCSMC